MANKYNSQKIEKKWQKTWEKEGIYKVKDSAKGKKNFYHLVMFPYPSGDLHIGHWYNFGPADIYARFKKMQGHNVLSPIGFDAFGLPAENAAIKRGIHPKDWTYKNIKTMTAQLKQMGNLYDWSRQVITADPEYYKWTQWMFLQLYKNGLAYKKKAPANWCPKDKTVLANEQVIDGKCDRCGTEVIQKEIEQWLFKITDYAEKLLNDLDGLDWPEKTKTMQRNWIGRSEGAIVKFPISNFQFPKKEKPTRISFVILNDKNQILIEKRKDGEFKGKWLIPGGKIEKNENILQTAIREIKEELGVKAEYLGLLGYFNSTIAKGDMPALVFKLKSGLPKIKEKERVFELKWQNSDEIPNNYFNYTTVDIFKAVGKYIKNGGLIPEHIEVFTTRVDTIFGCTYLVVAPENKLIANCKSQIENNKEVENYIKKSQKKTDLMRTDLAKDKTGVGLKGIKAINPFNGKEVPIFVADYVLGGYGTGAVMAVPAHDERDFEFAKKYNLPIKQSIAPHNIDIKNPPKKGYEDTVRSVVHIILENSKGEILTLNLKGAEWGNNKPKTLIIGGVENGESFESAALREIKEETGYVDVEIVKIHPIEFHAEFFAAHKNVNRYVKTTGVFCKLKSEKQVSVSEKEKEMHDIVWVKRGALPVSVTIPDDIFLANSYVKNIDTYTDYGVLINSGKFSGLNSEKAREEMAKWLEEKNLGKKTINYKLRDWLVSRQRYWGSPIPIVYCEKCASRRQGYGGRGEWPVPEKDLPVKLPDVKKYLPTEDGKSPLAHSEKFMKAKCPKCGGKATRETDTMDTFVCSSWYYLRYADNKNSKKPFDKLRVKKWLPVDMYIGGAEHTVLHLLYSRFFTKALNDFGYLNFAEPFKALRHQGIILGPDNQKMSKSRGNVVDPDELVEKFGADAVKMYLAFMGPYDQGGPWNPTGILGVKRFLNRIYQFSLNYAEEKKFGKAKNNTEKNLDKLLHQTIKKVGEDIEGFKFNTAISSLMVLLNEIEKNPQQLKIENWKLIIKLIAPFAPFLAESIWRDILENKKSIHLEKWPKYDPKLIIEDKFKLIVQINGKVRDSIDSVKGISENEAKELALKSEKVSQFISGKDIKKTIYVKDRLINFVV